VRDPETGEYRLEFEKPPPPPKDLTPEQTFQNTVLGTIAGKLGKPREQWSADDLLRADIRPLIDLLQSRSDIIVVPGWGPLRAEDIRERLRGTRPRPPAPSAPAPEAGPPPSAPGPQPRLPAGTEAPAVRPQTPTTPPPTSSAPGQETRALLPLVARYEQAMAGWSDSDLQRELEVVTTAETDAPSPINKAKLMAIGRIMAGRRRTPAPADPGRRSEREAAPADPRYVASYAGTFGAITPAGARQVVSHLRRAAPTSVLARAATQAYDQVYGQAQAEDPDAAAFLATSWPETAVQPQDPWGSPGAGAVTRVAGPPQGGAIPSLGPPPGQEEPRASRSDAAHRLARELFGKDLGQLSQTEMTTLNRELTRREAQGKQRYEDEFANQRALQDVRPQDFDRFFWRATGEPVPGTMQYGLVKALQEDPRVETSVVHLTTDNAKQLTTRKLLEPVLQHYADLIAYAYGEGGPLADYTREPLPILGAMLNQFAQSDPVLQAKRRALEGQLQSLVRALGSRGDLNAQELDMATNLIANLDASVGLGLTAGVGYGRGGVGPMIGFRPTISIPDSPRVGVQLANELIGLVNNRIGVLLQAPGYQGTPRITVPAGRGSLFGLPSAEKLEEQVEAEMGKRLRDLRQRQLTAPGWRWPWQSLEGQ
jgi:hypothetical protein